MSYTPINWQTGDTITAEKMNKMDNGWGITSSVLCEESITTEPFEGESYSIGYLTYATFISAPTITVTFNGTNYMVNLNDDADNGYCSYGEWGLDEPNFTNYPFFIESFEEEGGVSNVIYTANAGTYTIAVSAREIETSSEFDIAVNKAVTPVLKIVSGQTSWQEVYDAMQAGKPVLWYEYGDSNDELMCCYVSYIGISSHGDYEIRAVVWSGTAVTTKVLSTSSADGVFSW